MNTTRRRVPERTSHWVSGPLSPLDEMPETQSPVGSLGSIGPKERSLGSMVNGKLPKVIETTVVVEQGRVKLPWPSDLVPGIAA